MFFILNLKSHRRSFPYLPCQLVFSPVFNNSRRLCEGMLYEVSDEHEYVVLLPFVFRLRGL